MATKTSLKRGFKAEAERTAIEYREKLGIHPCAPLCAFTLAKFLNITVLEATYFLTSEEEKLKLSATGKDDCGWSALTMLNKDGKRLIIHNNYHTLARQQSNMMHEIAHVICGHEKKPLPKGITLPFFMRDFDKLQEEEAICLGATLQLPRPGLLWAKKSNMTNAEIASHFIASTEMVNFRIGSAGISRQFSFRKNQVN